MTGPLISLGFPREFVQVLQHRCCRIRNTLHPVCSSLFPVPGVVFPLMSNPPRSGGQTPHRVARAATPPFVKLYDHGLSVLDRIMLSPGGGGMAFRVWRFVLDHAGLDNALVVSEAAIARALGVDRTSVARAVKHLVSVKSLEVFRIGSARCFILNPEVVWRLTEDKKHMCRFGAAVLLAYDENPGLRAKLSHYSDQPALALEDA